MQNQEKKILLVLIQFCALAAFWWGFSYSRPPVGGDEFTYNVSAYAISQKGIIGGFQTFGQYAQRPLYPLVIAFFYKIFGYRPIVIFFFQIALAVSTVILVYFLAKKIFGFPRALAAGVLMILFPSLWAYTGIMMREVLLTFLTTTSLALSYLVMTEKKNWLSFSLGCSLGLLALTNSITVLLIIPLSFFLFLRMRKETPLKKNIFLGLNVFAPFILLVFGWMLFQNTYIQSKNITGDTLGLYLMEKYERMQIIEKNFSLYLLAHALGDYPATLIDPSYNRNTLRLGHNTRQLYNELLKILPPDMVEKKFFSEALQRFIKYPELFLKESLIDFFKLNTPLTPLNSMQPIFLEEHRNIPQFIKLLFIIAVRLAFTLLLFLVLFTAFKNSKKNPAYILFLIFILYLETMHIAVYATARYLLPLYPIFFMILAGSFHFPLIHNLQNKSRDENLKRKQN